MSKILDMAKDFEQNSKQQANAIEKRLSEEFTNYANASDLPAKALVDAGYDGIVSAGVGNGNLYKSVFDTLATAAKNGTVVVRSSRVPTGATTQDAEVDDAKYGFVASGTLNPQKARVLLQLALTQTKDPQQIQQIFNQY